MNSRTDPSFHKVGWNYQEDKSRNIPNFRANSIAWFKKYKHKDHPLPIRIMVKAQYMSIPYPFDLGTSNGVDNFRYHHDMALQFADDPDFHVIFNVYAGPMTKDSFALSRQSIIQYATLLESMGYGDKIELSINNEQSGTFGIQYGIASLTQTGGVATLTVTGATFLTHVGDTFTIWNSNRAQYNTTHTVTEYDPSNPRVVKFNIDPATPATATGAVYSMSIPELRQAMIDLYQDLKLVYSGLISIGELGSTVNGQNSWTDWIAHAGDDRPIVSVHVYPGTNRRGDIPAPELAALQALAPKTYISEFNINGGNVSGAQAMGWEGVNAQRALYKNMDAIIELCDYKWVVYWSWDSNLNIQNTDGTVHPFMHIFTTNNGRKPLAMYNRTRMTATHRTAATHRTPITVARTAV